ncbi:PIN domain-containing protein [Candidatus Pacearchaeota archaeon]|nr:PIN domain-containing protein [Candidatus Pacearchaeota archaeon]
MTSYFFDSFAFFEIIRGNPNYSKFSTNTSIITTKMNLMELYYWLLRREGKEMADKYYEKFLPYCVEITDHDIKRACEFRLQNKNKELSYIDCIGYIIAVEKKIKFLTGDEGFRNIGNVEFVK